VTSPCFHVSLSDMRRTLFHFVLCGFLLSSGGARAGADAMNAVAERYVHLVLALGQHDPDYVDAFYGPVEWKTQAEKENKSLDAIGTDTAELSATLAKTPDAATSGDEMLKLRHEYLQKQISALAARVRMLKGEKLKFDDESCALYDAVAPTYPDSHFDQIIAQLEAKIPGKGPLWQRYENWRKPFVIPKEKLDTVFQLAIKECRARTLAHVSLPPNESFTVEYVTNKPWGGYNWCKGNFHSVIQVNTDLQSISIARSISRRTKVIPAIMFTIRCWKRTWCAIAAGWSFRFTHCSRRNRLSRKGRRISAGTLRSRLRPRE
jgi:hypothetical protein